MSRILAIACLCLLAAPAPASAQRSTVAVPMVFTPPTTTIAALPTCNALTAGYVFRVTDALLPALNIAVAGGGAVSVLVRCNGTNWLVGQ